MASRPGSPTADVDTDTPESTAASFSQAETIHILDKLIADPATYLSGNGLKTKTLPPSFVKGIFEEYEFVRGKSGVGWDDEEKKATAEPEFIERFLEAQHAKYAKCFKQGCPYYDHLTRLFGGNKATGENVLHLKKPRATASSSRSAATSSRSAAASSRSAAASLPKPAPPHLLPPPAKRARSAPTPIEIDSDADDETKKTTNQRDRSASGSRRVERTAEAGNQIARGLKSIGEGMSAPIITKADTSHVDAVVDVLNADPTLLPDDPEGEYYAVIIDALSANEGRARAFVKTTKRTHRIGFLKRILMEHSVILPANWV
ncbi:hypothetical protein B0H19DRAFT_1139911 [Mycena capillaripes]|nr:hypothetical protein B0H19DRAFT_1139911 [Mycena capillaripes]